MTDSPHSTAADTEPEATDPETLRERPDVAYVETTEIHDDAAHYESHRHDTAVVGVTTGDGSVLCLLNEDRGLAVLPFEPVEPAAVREPGDWTAACRDALGNWCIGTGLAIAVDRPERVRRVEHVVAGEDESRSTSYDVAFRASPVEADPDLENLTGSDDWTAGWYDGVPAVAPATPDRLADDIRLFVG